MRKKRARSFECRGAAVDPWYHVTFSLILALICVTQPFNPPAQFIFLMLRVALIVRRMRALLALMLIAVADRFLPLYRVALPLIKLDDPVSLVCYPTLR